MLKRLVNFFSEVIHSSKIEFKLFFKDSAVYVSFLGTSLVVCFLYSFIYGKEVVHKLPIAVVDQDNSAMSRELVRMADATQGISIYKNTTSLLSAKKLFYENDVRGILFIPKDFTSKLLKGQQTSISAYADASYLLYYKNYLNSLNAALGTYNAQIEVNGMMKKGLNIRNASVERRVLNIQSVPLFNPYSGYATSIIPVVALIIIQTTLLTAIGILGGTQRESKTMFKDYGFEVGKRSIFPDLIGRGLAYLSFCIFVLLIVVGFAFSLFRLPERGGLWEILLFMIPFFLSVIFMGTMMIGLFRKREDCLFVFPFMSLPALFLTGGSWPTAAMPEFIQQFAYILPTTVGVKGFEALTQFGASLSDIKDLYGQMWITCLVYFVLALIVERNLLMKSKEVMATA